MACQVDVYYSTAIEAPSIVPGGNSCGACTLKYDNCSSSGSGTQPDCCPSGYEYVGDTGCGSCTYAGGTIGKKFLCRPKEPDMNGDDAQQRKVNCCVLTQNLPKNTPNGYCATGWCPGGDSCNSFMTQYCQGSKLGSPECLQFCRKNIGSCDTALTDFCKNPANFNLGVCGCALPTDQYPLSKYKSGGVQIPITCDRRCDVNKDAIRLLGQQDCKIKTICEVNANDVKVVTAAKGPGIVINQNCGNNNSGENFFEKYWYLFLIMAIIIIMAMILVILL